MHCNDGMHCIRWGTFTSAAEMFHIVRTRLSATYRLPMHRHEGFVECCFVETGRLWHHLPRRRELIEAGSLLLIRSHDVHMLKPTEDETVFTNVAFPTRIFRDLLRRYPKESWASLWDATSARPSVVHVETALRARLIARFDVLAKAPRTRFEIERFLLNLFYDVRVMPQSIDATALPLWLQRACRGIHEPDALRTGLPAFMRLAGRSPEHVARTLKRFTGRTPTDVVNEARLTEAARRLCMTDDEIIEVADACGFENLSYFYRLFRQRYGQSPRRYRMLNHAVA